MGLDERGHIPEKSSDTGAVEVSSAAITVEVIRFKLLGPRNASALWNVPPSGRTSSITLMELQPVIITASKPVVVMASDALSPV